MVFTSKGYDGTVDDADWAVFTAHMGGTYSVFGDTGSFAIAPGSGDRQVVIGPGVASGAGILDTSDSPETLAGSVVSSGSRWDMVVLRREWGEVNATSVHLIEGGTTKALPAREAAPGDVDDQPLFLVRFAAGQTAVQEIVDLRVWRSDGGLFASELLVRSYMDRVGTKIEIGGVLWTRGFSSGVAVWLPFSTLSNGLNQLRVNASGRFEYLVAATPQWVVDENGRLVTGRVPFDRTTGTLDIDRGGTGAVSARQARTNLEVISVNWGSTGNIGAGSSREFEFELPSAGTWAVSPSVNNRFLSTQWVITGATVRVVVYNDTASTRSGQVTAICVKST